MADELLRVTDLVKHYPLPRPLFSREARAVKAVDGVSLRLDRGETLGIVGESGCGKTTLSRAILRLVEPNSGSIVFRGRDITHIAGEDLRRERRHMQIIFQDPFGSLNPRMTVRDLIDEPLRVHSPKARETRADRILEALDMVGMGARVLNLYPHEFSGGQRQRLGIARALVLHPELLVGDEPVSALDVSVRAQILNLLKRLQKRTNTSYIIVSHDLGAVRYICHRVAVMYLGRVIEEGPVEAVFREPLHPYTQALVAAVPVPRIRRGHQRQILRGEVPSPIDPPAGCHFHPRCAHRMTNCAHTAPSLIDLGGGRKSACHLHGSGGGPASVSETLPSPQPPPAFDVEANKKSPERAGAMQLKQWSGSS